MSTNPFNPAPCCILGVCCPPENPDSAGKRVQALVGVITATAPTAQKLDTFVLNQIAAVVLDSYDLVPKGLGAAIVAAYEPHFRQKLAR